MVSRTSRIEEYCRNCGYDETAPGTFLEQIATCPVVSCALRPVRPMPRHCRANGEPVQAAIDAIDRKIAAIDRRWAAEGR
jgi:hypothetical protein